MTTLQEEHNKRMVMRLALKRVRELKQLATDYLAEVDHYYRHGEGRRKGYTFPYCFHGTSRWTDYDNICRGCEESMSPYLTGWMYEMALGEAKSAVAEFQRRAEWLASAPKGFSSQNQDIRQRLTEWVCEPIKGWRD